MNAEVLLDLCKSRLQVFLYMVLSEASAVSIRLAHGRRA